MLLDKLSNMVDNKEIRHFLSKPDLEINSTTNDDDDSGHIITEYCHDERILIVRVDYDIKTEGDGWNYPYISEDKNHRVNECSWDDGEEISLDDETEKLLISMVQ